MLHVSSNVENELCPQAFPSPVCAAIRIYTSYHKRIYINDTREKQMNNNSKSSGSTTFGCHNRHYKGEKS